MGNQRVFLKRLITIFLVFLIMGFFVNQVWADAGGTIDTESLNSLSIDSNGTAITGDLGVSGASTLNGINNGNDGITSAGSISGTTTISANNTISTTAGMTVGSTLGVTGLATLNGGITAEHFTVADGTGALPVC